MSLLQQALSVYQAEILPRAVSLGEVAFRHVRKGLQDDYKQEMLGLLWVWTLRLLKRGKDPAALAVPLVFYAVRAVKSGRCVCGAEGVRDALSFTAQKRKHFCVAPLPQTSTMSGNVWDEALACHTQAPVPDQAAFRIDFPQWLSAYDERRRRIIAAMAEGGRTQDLAKRFKLSQARISQMRRELRDSWRVFTGERS